MARHKKKAGHNNSERWLVSYADLLTLLFAFFVVLFASTQTDKARAKQISQAVDKALQSSSLPPRVAAILGGTVDDKGRGNAQLKGPAVATVDHTKDEPPQMLDLNSAMKTLRSTLNAEMKQGQVQIHLEARGAVVSLNTQAVFPSGDDSISSTVIPLIEKVSATLTQLPNPIRLEGHTDSLPIRNERFRSNWELSAARSIAMLRILNERYGISRDRMAIIGYADTNAIGDNNTEEGRSRNRRVDIVLLNDFGTKSEPKTGGDTACSPNCPKSSTTAGIADATPLSHP